MPVPLAWPTMESRMPLVTESFAHLQELVLLIDSKATFGLGKWLISHTRNLQSLTVPVIYGLRALKFMSVGPQNSATRADPNEFAQELLGGVSTNQNRVTNVLNLTSLTRLTLFSVDLSSSFETWSHFAPFRQLHTLELRNCSGSAQFLDGLSAL